jgi:hypothetical protein
MARTTLRPSSAAKQTARTRRRRGTRAPSRASVDQLELAGPIPFTGKEQADGIDLGMHESGRALDAAPGDARSEQKAEVLRLRYVERLSVRAIATPLAMSRRFVRGMLGDRKPTAPRQHVLRVSLLAADDSVIRDALKKTPDLRAPAMLERLRALGDTGGISILRKHMRIVRPRPMAAVFSTFTTRPGERLEVDWADLGYLVPAFGFRPSKRRPCCVERPKYRRPTSTAAAHRTVLRSWRELAPWQTHPLQHSSIRHLHLRRSGSRPTPLHSTSLRH